MWSVWWVWMLTAVVLAILELALPGYILLGFAVGVALVGVGLMVGILGPLTDMAGGYGFTSLLILASVLSGAAWFGIRAVFGPPGQTAQTFEKDINDD